MTIALSGIWISSTQMEKAHPCDGSSGHREDLSHFSWSQRSYATWTLRFKSLPSTQGFPVEQGGTKSTSPSWTSFLCATPVLNSLLCSYTQNYLSWLTRVFDLALFSPIATPPNSSAPAGTCLDFLFLHSLTLWLSLVTRSETRSTVTNYNRVLLESCGVKMDDH